MAHEQAVDAERACRIAVLQIEEAGIDRGDRLAAPGGRRDGPTSLPVAERQVRREIDDPGVQPQHVDGHGTRRLEKGHRGHAVVANSPCDLVGLSERQGRTHRRLRGGARPDNHQHRDPGQESNTSAHVRVDPADEAPDPVSKHTV